MRILTGFIAAGLTVGVATAAMAQTDGWYVGAEAGLNLVPKIKFKSSPTSWKQEQDPGEAVLGQVGYGFGQVRVEGEIGWRNNGVSKVNEIDAKGGLNAYSAMANAYYDIPTGTAWTPYVGAGVGAVDVSAHRIRAASVGITNDNDYAFAYQGILGVAYAINDHLSVKGDYRYFRTAEAALNEDAQFGAGKGKGDYAAHSIMVGFTYKFGQPKPAPVAAAAPAPAPAPMPAPKPVQAAPIAKNYMVFFDFNKSNITPEAGKIIHEAAANAKANKATAIHLTGHTDTVGSDKYNMALSIRRANAVKAVLVQQGIPADEITVVGKGKSDPLVPTKDGVREPQNRRVQIVLD